MNGWTTRYWKTQGIEFFDDYENCGSVRNRLVRGRGYGDPNYRFDKIGRDVFLTEAEAVADMRKKVEANIESLEKSLAKSRAILEKLESGNV